MWPVASLVSGSGGVLRVRAVLAAVGGLWSWGWAISVVRVPLGVVLLVGLWVVRAGRRSAGLGASVWSVRLSAAGVVLGGVFVVFGGSLVVVAYQRGGVVGLIGALLAA